MTVCRDQNDLRLSRRNALKGLGAAGACLALGVNAQENAAQQALTRAIPSTGEQLPVVGIGTNAFDVTDPGEIEERSSVLTSLPLLGGSVVDSARGYGLSEQVIGRILAGNEGLRDRIFLATKPVSAPQSEMELTPELIGESFSNLQTDTIDLLQVHSLVRLDELIPVYREYKQEGRIRYIGITTSTSRQYSEFLDAMRTWQPDFIQVNYSIADRSAAEEVLPLARDMGIAVLNNVPFGGSRGSLFPLLSNYELPEWAVEFGIGSWAQFMLKYNLAQPDITAIIPGTTSYRHLADNQKAAQGPLPDAELLGRMDAFWASVEASE